MWQPCYSLETLKLASNVISVYQGCQPDGLSVSVYGGLIIYVLTIAGLNGQKGTFNMCFIEVHQTPILYDYMEWLLKHV